MQVFLLIKNNDPDLWHALNHGHQGFEAAGTIPKIGLVIEFGDDNLWLAFFQQAGSITHGVDCFNLETTALIEGFEIGITAELNDRYENPFVLYGNGPFLMPAV
jgi:hypothetical protein